MKPKKSLGQNFLISKRITEKIVASADVKTGETILEIGPGKGALTRELLRAGAMVIAIEKDGELVSLLQETFREEILSGRLTIIRDDIRNFSINPEFNVLGSQFKIVANIPYYITGEILRQFLSLENKPETIVLMVQKEVANRLKDKKESVLSLSVKAYGSVSLVCNVSRGNFYPIPNVDSAVIKIDNIQNPFANKTEEENFFKLVKTGFAHKRKFLISNLKNLSETKKLEGVFEKLSINKKSRPEEIDLDLWKKLASEI